MKANPKALVLGFRPSPEKTPGVQRGLGPATPGQLSKAPCDCPFLSSFPTPINAQGLALLCLLDEQFVSV